MQCEYYSLNVEESNYKQTGRTASYRVRIFVNRKDDFGHEQSIQTVFIQGPREGK